MYFLAGILAVTHSFTAVRLVQILLGTAAIGFIFSMARAWFGARAAWIAAVLATLTGVFTFYEVLILQSSVDTFFTAAALYALTRGLAPAAGGDAGRPGQAWLLTAGLVWGIETLNRPNVLVAAAGVAVALLIATRRLRPAAALVAGLALGMAPVAIRNIVVAHEWTPVSSHGGLNFYIGNNEHADGFYHQVPGVRPTIEGQSIDTQRVAARALGHPVSEGEASAYFFRLALTWAGAHPIDAAVLFVKKVGYAFHAQHIALPQSYPFYRGDTALRFYPVDAWLLAPLGLAGLVFAGAPRQRDRRSSYLVWVSFVPAYAAAVALFFVAERYRLPLMVPLTVGAGGLIDVVWGAIAAGRTRTLAAPAAVAAVLLILVNLPLGLNDSRWQEGLRLAQRLVILGRYDEAAAWATKLQKEEPSPGAADYGVGAQLLLQGDDDRALPYLLRAHQAAPDEPRVDYALGQALLKIGRPAEAVPHLRHGFDAGVEIPGGGYDLAVALQASGDLPGAAAALGRIHLPEEAGVDTWLRAGRLAMEARAPLVAEPYFRRAVQLAPGLPAARQQYGLALLVLGRFEDAARELGEAVRLDPRDPDSLSHLAFCEARLDRIPDARAHAAAALAINPADPLARQLLIALK